MTHARRSTIDRRNGRGNAASGSPAKDAANEPLSPSVGGKQANGARKNKGAETDKPKSQSVKKNCGGDGDSDGEQPTKSTRFKTAENAGKGAAPTNITQTGVTTRRGSKANVSRAKDTEPELIRETEPELSHKSPTPSAKKKSPQTTIAHAPQIAQTAQDARAVSDVVKAASYPNAEASQVSDQGAQGSGGACAPVAEDGATLSGTPEVSTRTLRPRLHSGIIPRKARRGAGTSPSVFPSTSQRLLPELLGLGVSDRPDAGTTTLPHPAVQATGRSLTLQLAEQAPDTGPGRSEGDKGGGERSTNPLDAALTNVTSVTNVRDVTVVASGRKVGENSLIKEEAASKPGGKTEAQVASHSTNKSYPQIVSRTGSSVGAVSKKSKNRSKLRHGGLSSGLSVAGKKAGARHVGNARRGGAIAGARFRQPQIPGKRAEARLPTAFTRGDHVGWQAGQGQALQRDGPDVLRNPAMNGGGRNKGWGGRAGVEAQGLAITGLSKRDWPLDWSSESYRPLTSLRYSFIVPANESSAHESPTHGVPTNRFPTHGVSTHEDGNVDKSTPIFLPPTASTVATAPAIDLPLSFARLPASFPKQEPALLESTLVEPHCASRSTLNRDGRKNGRRDPLNEMKLCNFYLCNELERLESVIHELDTGESDGSLFDSKNMQASPVPASCTQSVGITPKHSSSPSKTRCSWSSDYPVSTPYGLSHSMKIFQRLHGASGNLPMNANCIAYTNHNLNGPWAERDRPSLLTTIRSQTNRLRRASDRSWMSIPSRTPSHMQPAQALPSQTQMRPSQPALQLLSPPLSQPHQPPALPSLQQQMPPIQPPVQAVAPRTSAPAEEAPAAHQPAPAPQPSALPAPLPLLPQPSLPDPSVPQASVSQAVEHSAAPINLSGSGLASALASPPAAATAGTAAGMAAGTAAADTTSATAKLSTLTSRSVKAPVNAPSSAAQRPCTTSSTGAPATVGNAKSQASISTNPTPNVQDPYGLRGSRKVKSSPSHQSPFLSDMTDGGSGSVSVSVSGSRAKFAKGEQTLQEAYLFPDIAHAFFGGLAMGSSRASLGTQRMWRTFDGLNVGQRAAQLFQLKLQPGTNLNTTMEKAPFYLTSCTGRGFRPALFCTANVRPTNGSAGAEGGGDENTCSGSRI